MDEPGIMLLEWFKTHQRRLPWRTPFPRDPYPVLLSELMLQQTPVQRVVPRFLRFLEKFPTLAALAGASDDAVLAAWSGLGYYRRARALHAAARAISAAGGWPRSRRQLQRLPGFGPYTAAALAAFCFAGDDPPVDGNVARVAARVHALAVPLGSGELSRAAARWARRLHRAAPVPDTFEALIELGAQVCRPTAPVCSRCPLAGECAAAATGTPGRYPAPRLRRPRQSLRWVALWVQRDDGKVLLRRQPRERLLGGLWLPPLVELADGEQPAAAAARLRLRLGWDTALRPAPPVTHSITHRDITIFPFGGTCAAIQVCEADDLKWEDPGAADLPTSTLTRKLRLTCARLGPASV